MVSQTNNKYHNIISNYYSYNIDESNDKYESYGYRLIEIIHEVVNSVENAPYIIDRDYHNAHKQRTVDYIVARILNIGYYNKKIDEDENNNESEKILLEKLNDNYEKILLEKLKEFLDVDEKTIHKISILTKKICLNSNSTEPTQTQKNSIRKEAQIKRHNCYICGRLLDANKQTKTKKKRLRKKLKKVHIKEIY